VHWIAEPPATSAGWHGSGDIQGSLERLALALSVFADHDVDVAILSGDITHHGDGDSIAAVLAACADATPRARGRRQPRPSPTTWIGSSARTSTAALRTWSSRPQAGSSTTAFGSRACTSAKPWAGFARGCATTRPHGVGRAGGGPC
jgi:hypothetical protein